MEIDNKYAPLIHDRRLAAAAAEDRPQRHGRRGRPGHQSSPEVEGGLDDPARLDPAERQPRRDPRLARRRHPAVPEAAAGERRRGPRRKGRDVKLSDALRRLEPFARDLARISGALAKRRAEHRQLDPQLPAALRPSSATRTRTWPTSSTPRTPCSAPSPSRRPRSAGAVRSCPARSRRPRAR